MSPTSNDTPSLRNPATTVAHWAMRLTTAAGLGLSIYLSWVSMTVDATALGCDPGGGCDDVLTSAWSKWQGIPVALIAACLFGSMFIATWLIGLRSSPRIRSAAWHLLIIGSIAAVGAAGWFVYVQRTVIQNYCPYCLATHTAGAATALLVLCCAPIGWRRGAGTDATTTGSISIQRLATLIGVGIACTAALVIGQQPTRDLTSPPDHVIEIEPPVLIATPEERQPIPDRAVSILDDRITLRTSENLILGNPNAPHIIVFVFDYTCPHCRIAHAHLEQALQRYPDQIAVLAIPFPLDADCNAMVQKTRPKHVYACELAETVWATWQVNTQAFHQLDHWIASKTYPPSPMATNQQAAQFLKERGHVTPLKKWPIDHLVRSAATIYKTAGGGTIPKIIFGKAIVNGPPANAQQLFRLLEEQFDLTPPAGE